MTMMPPPVVAPNRPSPSGTSSLQQPLEEVLEAAVEKGKRRAKRVKRKVAAVVGSAARGGHHHQHQAEQDDVPAQAPAQAPAKAQAAPGSVIADGRGEGRAGPKDDEDFPENAQSGGGSASPPAGEEAERSPPTPKRERSGSGGPVPAAPSSPPPASKPSTPPDAPHPTVPWSEAVLLAYASILTAYLGWGRRSPALVDEYRVPLSSVVPLLSLAFLLGYHAKAYSAGRAAASIGESLSEIGSILTRRTSVVTNAVINGSRAPDGADERRKSVAFSNATGDGPRSHVGFRDFMRRRRDSLRRFGNRYIKRDGSDEGPIERTAPSSKKDARNRADDRLFWSSLSSSEKEFKECERRVRAAFSQGPFAHFHAKYPDLYRRMSRRSRLEAETLRLEPFEESVTSVETTKAAVEDLAMGNAKLNNTRAESLEAVEEYTHVMDPMTELRGMDLFLSDDPEEEIWRQPLLTQCGLRDMPTFIANILMPFGNMTAYFKLPDWFDDFGNIPGEKEDDLPGVKALKRFLLGDNEYRNARAKVIPFIVDGPLAIRLINPGPVDKLIDGPRHPTKWFSVPKSVDPVSGKEHAAVLECDIDLFSEKTIRKIINIIRPHLQSITIDVALIISQPEGSELDEPSACLGLWRIEKVDFESCAVFPELGIEDAAEEVKMIMSRME